MSLSAGRSCSWLFPHDASTAVTPVNHPPCSPLALWQAVNEYQRPHHASTLYTITNLLLSLSCSLSCLLFLSLYQLARRCSVPCLSTRWKRVRRWVELLTLLFLLPQWRVECLNSNLSLCCVSAHLSKHPSVSARVHVLLTATLLSGVFKATMCRIILWL